MFSPSAQLENPNPWTVGSKRSTISIATEEVTSFGESVPHRAVRVDVVPTDSDSGAATVIAAEAVAPAGSESMVHVAVEGSHEPANWGVCGFSSMGRVVSIDWTVAHPSG
jgi:hypothetical protein